MNITKVQGLMTLLDFRVTQVPDVDGFWGVGVMLRDKVKHHFAAYFFIDGNVASFLIGLARMGVEYEIRDESVDIAVPTLLGVERLEQTREFIRPCGHGDFIPIAKRVAFTADDTVGFHQQAIPARTP